MIWDTLITIGSTLIVIGVVIFWGYFIWREWKEWPAIAERVRQRAGGINPESVTQSQKGKGLTIGEMVGLVTIAVIGGMLGAVIGMWIGAWIGKWIDKGFGPVIGLMVGGMLGWVFGAGMAVRLIYGSGKK